MLFRSAELAAGKTLADATSDLSASDGATIYIVPWYGESLIPSGTTVNQYIEFTFTVSGLDSTTTD